MTLRDLKSFHHKHDSLSTCTVHIWFLLVCNVHSMQYFQIQFWSSRVCADNNDRFWSGGPGQAPQAFGLGPCFMLQLWRPCPLLPNGCTDQDSTWYGGWPRLRPQCAWYGPSSPPRTGAQQPPNFSAHILRCCAGLVCLMHGRRPACVRKPRPMSITAKRSPTSASAEHLSHI